MNSPKYSLNLTPLARNFGEKYILSFAVGTRLSIRLTYPLWRENRFVWRKFKKVKREVKREVKRGIDLTLCRWSSLKHFSSISIFSEKYRRLFAVGTRQRVLIKFFSLNSVVFLWRKKINEWFESLIALMTCEFSRLSFPLSKNISEPSELLITLMTREFSRLS